MLGTVHRMNQLPDGVFLTRFEITDDGCWLWKGPTREANGSIYGRARWNGRMQQAHRVFYELANNPIPEGFQCDHLCGRTLCVNPDHIEVVTGRENTLRGNGPTAQNARKTHCLRGHLLEGENLYQPKPSQPINRRCKECERGGKRSHKEQRRLYQREYRRRKKVR
jgi:hypothetical protein